MMTCLVSVFMWLVISSLLSLASAIYVPFFIEKFWGAPIRWKVERWYAFHFGKTALAWFIIVFLIMTLIL